MTDIRQLVEQWEAEFETTLYHDLAWDSDYGGSTETLKVFRAFRGMAEKIATLAMKHQRELDAARLQAVIDHAAINDLRLAPRFGKPHGEPAIRATTVEAVAEAIRSQP